MVMATLSPPWQESLNLNVTVAIAGERGRLGFTDDELIDALTVMVAGKFRDARIVTDDTEILNVALNLSCVSNACSWRVRLTTKMVEGPFGTLSLGDWWGAGGVLRTSDVFDRLMEELDRALDRPAAAWLRLSEEQRECWRQYFAEPLSRLPQCDEANSVRKTGAHDRY
jgi:hypothetical protein